jgi:hypothetical protein
MLTSVSSLQRWWLEDAGHVRLAEEEQDEWFPRAAREPAIKDFVTGRSSCPYPKPTLRCEITINVNDDVSQVR